ncbi:hypothetical protein GCM10023116_34740 [Kistimonas scapharcae]|uniref:Uncharacterized protein n=1 Tax=Kistimonas scapharcae TaxID=1036133 RepID=A0ABP8V5M3_9GAMM
MATSISKLPFTSYKNPDRPFAVKIQRLTCQARIEFGSPPSSPHAKNDLIKIGDRKISEYHLNDAGIHLIKGERGKIFHELSESGKFYEFEPDSLPFPTTSDRRWVFKQENVLSEDQLTKLNTQHQEVYTAPEAYKADSMGYLHTSLRSIGQRIMAKAFGLEKYFVDVCLAADHEGHFGLLMPFENKAINADQWLNMHGYIIGAVKKPEEKEHLRQVLKGKNRYQDHEYHKTANRVFDQFNLPALKVIKFIDQRCNQTDRTKLSNILLIGDSNSNNPRKFSILGIDQDLAFANIPKGERLGRESDPNFPFDIRPLAPCCKQWIHRLNDVLKPILPFDDQRMSEVIFDDINTVFPSLADSCRSIEAMTSSSSESSPHSSKFSGSGGRITPVELFPDTPVMRPDPSQFYSVLGTGGRSAEEAMPLEASVGKKRPYSETLMVPYCSAQEGFIPQPSTSSAFFASGDSDGTETENLPSLDSLSSIGTLVFEPTLEEEQRSQSPDQPSEEPSKRPRQDSDK